MGALFGALFGALVQYADSGAGGGVRVGHEHRADRYDVQVDDDVAEEAERLLAAMPATR